jgi:hypothetical protein
LTAGHVIAESLGGFLACKNICKSCNSSIGETIEAHAREDPLIRRISEELRDSIPELAAIIRNRQASTSVDEQGNVIPWIHKRLMNTRRRDFGASSRVSWQVAK